MRKKNVLSTTTATTICQLINLLNFRQQQKEVIVFQNQINDNFTTINGYHSNLYRNNKILNLAQLIKIILRHFVAPHRQSKPSCFELIFGSISEFCDFFGFVDVMISSLSSPSSLLESTVIVWII